MEVSKILQPADDGSGKRTGIGDSSTGQPEKPSSGFTDEDTKVKRPGKDVKPGPSGKIKPE